MSSALLNQLVRFAGVGLTGLLVDVGITVGLIRVGSDPFTARAIAILLTMITTWRLNRALTFGASSSSQTGEGLRYFSVAAIVAIINYALYSLLIITLPGVPSALAVMMAVAAATGLSFIGYRNFAFKADA